MSFGPRYLAALRDNLNSRFDCKTLKLCRKFKLLLDPTLYIYPRTDFSSDDPLASFQTFKTFIDDIPFLASDEAGYKKTLYFQLQELRKKTLQSVLTFRGHVNEDLNIVSFLKLLYNSLDIDTMGVVRYFMSCVVAFLVSEAVVETWGSVIDKVISSKISFKESEDIEKVDITEQIVFLKLVGPSIGATSNRRLFQRALTLMYNGRDYPKLFMSPRAKGFTSVVIQILTGG